MFLLLAPFQFGWFGLKLIGLRVNSRFKWYKNWYYQSTFTILFWIFTSPINYLNHFNHEGHIQKKQFHRNSHHWVHTFIIFSRFFPSFKFHRIFIRCLVEDIEQACNINHIKFSKTTGNFTLVHVMQVL